MNNNNGWLDQNTLAELLTVEPETLTKWNSEKRYDLKPQKRGRKVYYPKSLIKERFFGRLSLCPLLTRKTASHKLSISHRTISDQDFIQKYDLQPIRIGCRLVRYHPDIIESIRLERLKYVQDRMRP